jgi:hypothetical protein
MQKSLKKAFEEFINKDNRVSKLLAKFVHEVLRKGSKVNVRDIESTLDNVVFLYGYISEKDVFERDYQCFLSNRLLMGLCESEHSEKSMIAKLKTECVTRDHSVLVRGRGWVPIYDVRIGDQVWSLQSRSAATADWSAVTAVTGPLAVGDNDLVHFSSSKINLLVSRKHVMWTAPKTSEKFSLEHAESVSGQRRIALSAHSAAEHYKWDRTELPFLPADINSDADKALAWCELLGFWIGDGGISMNNVHTAGYTESQKIVSLSQSANKPEQVAKLQAVLKRLGWDQPREASDPQPYFYRVEEKFIAYHAALYDYLWPMAFFPGDFSSSAPMPLKLAARCYVALARGGDEAALWQPRAGRPVLAKEDMAPRWCAEEQTYPADFDHPANAALREWGRAVNARADKLSAFSTEVSFGHEESKSSFAGQYFHLTRFHFATLSLSRLACSCFRETSMLIFAVSLFL